MLLRRFYVQENTKGENSKRDKPDGVTDMRKPPSRTARAQES